MNTETTIISTKKTVAKKTPIKKTPIKKTVAKKTPIKKTVAKKTPIKKTVAKKTPAAAKVVKSDIKEKLGFDPVEVAEYTPAVIDFNPTNYDFPVATMRPTVTIGDKVIPLIGQTVLVRTDTNKVLGQFGGHYNVIPHALTINSFEQIISDDPILKHFDRKVTLTHGGARMFSTYTFKKADFKLNGDAMMPRLTVINTLDRSLRWQIILELYRLACINGMITPFVINVSEIHTKNRLNEETINGYLTEIRNNMREIPTYTEGFRALGQIEITDPIKTMAELWESKKPIFNFPKKYAGNVMQEFESQKGRTAWHFYNAFNSVINRGFMEQNRSARGRLLDLNLHSVFHGHFKG